VTGPFAAVLRHPSLLFISVQNLFSQRCSRYGVLCKYWDRLCGLVIRVPGYGTEIYCFSCGVRTEFIYVMQKKVDRLCSLVIRFPGYGTEMHCVSCGVRTEFIYVMQKKVDRLCGLVVRVPGYSSRDPGSIPGATRFSEK
jgi:hypothetical protein